MNRIITVVFFIILLKINIFSLAQNDFPKKISHKIDNFSEINSSSHDFGIIPFRDGYIFVTDRDLATSKNDEKYMKLCWYQPSQNKIQTIAALDNHYHVGPACLDKKSNILYFTQSKKVKIRQKNNNFDPTNWENTAKNEGYVNRLEIYYSHYENGKWGKPIPFSHNNSQVYSVGHPAISPCGAVLYFISDMNGFGETDIFYSTRVDDNTWSGPKNLGNKINSSSKEMFPTIDYQGVLYFSSNRSNPKGNLDLYKSSGSMDMWTEPEKLEDIFNSDADDFSLFFYEDSKSGYFSSNRSGGKGSDDIYMFKIQDTGYVHMTFIVEAFEKQIDGHSKESINDIKLYLETEKIEHILQQKFVNNMIIAEVKRNIPYVVSGKKEGYFVASKTIIPQSSKESDTVYVEMYFEKIEMNKPVVINNIYFEFDKFDIDEKAKSELDKLVELMKKNPEIIVELSSHTDSRGGEEYNQQLSQKRAEATVSYIRLQGISSKRIKAKGYGESKLTNHCKDFLECTDEEHQQNRRTEFTVVGLVPN